MNEHQSYLLMLIKEIDDICRKHGITYFTIGGSLIGAIRHEGFIPWDDDADIAMTPRNFAKFAEICEKELPEGRTLMYQRPGHREYTNSVARYMALDSAAIHKSEMASHCPAGMIVDIFVLDPIPNDKDAIFNYKRDLMLYSDLISPLYMYSPRMKVNRLRYPLYRFASFFVGKDRMLTRLEKRMFKYDEDECELTVLRWGGSPLVTPKSNYGKPYDVNVEGLPVMVPQNGPDYLTIHYGDDWMYLPANTEQTGHLAVHNLEHGYEGMRTSLLKLMSRGKINRAERKRKRLAFRHMNNRNRLKDLNHEVTKAGAIAKLNWRLAKPGIDPDRMLKERDFAGLSLLFSEYFNAQLSKEIIGRENFAGLYRLTFPMLLDIDPHLFYIAVYTLINTGRISKAYRILEVDEQIGKYNNSETAYLSKMISDIRAAISQYSYGNYRECLNLTNQYLMLYKGDQSLRKLKVRTLLKLDAAGYEKEINELLDGLIGEYPADGELLKYRGDLCLVHNDLGAAADYYRQSAMTTNNGYVWLEMKHFFAENNDLLIKQIAACKDMEEFGSCMEFAMKFSADPVSIRAAAINWRLIHLEDEKEAFEYLRELAAEPENIRTEEAVVKAVERIWEGFEETAEAISVRKALFNADKEQAKKIVLELQGKNSGTELMLLSSALRKAEKFKDAWETALSCIGREDLSILAMMELRALIHDDMEKRNEAFRNFTFRKSAYKYELLVKYGSEEEYDRILREFAFDDEDELVRLTDIVEEPETDAPEDEADEAAESDTDEEDADE